MTDAKPAEEKPRWKRQRWLYELWQGNRRLGSVEKSKGRNLWLWHVHRPPSTSGDAESYEAAKVYMDRNARRRLTKAAGQKIYRLLAKYVQATGGDGITGNVSVPAETLRSLLLEAVTNIP